MDNKNVSASKLREIAIEIESKAKEVEDLSEVFDTDTDDVPPLPPQ